MIENSQMEFVASAFVSCSLRKEDKPFVEFIERILIAHRIRVFGTVGLYSASPENVAVHMKENIPQSDFVVIVATPRYIQKDLKSGKITYGLSEMVHVEAGMAYMAEKPVIAFVKEGTEVGGFLPNVTQFIILNGQQKDLESKWALINSLIRNAYEIVRQLKEQAANKSLWRALTTGFAIFGGFKLVEILSDQNKPKTTRNRKTK